MPTPLSDSAALPALRSFASDADHSRQRLELEVVELFDEFRLPLLRYLSSFGLPLADGEEVLQEVFLSLFQHLQRGKSRENLRGWLFRVAHNLGLKRRYRAGRDLEQGSATPAIDPLPIPKTRCSPIKFAGAPCKWPKRFPNKIAAACSYAPKVCAIAKSPVFSTCR